MFEWKDWLPFFSPPLLFHWLEYRCTLYWQPKPFCSVKHMASQVLTPAISKMWFYRPLVIFRHAYFISTNPVFLFFHRPDSFQLLSRWNTFDNVHIKFHASNKRGDIWWDTAQPLDFTSVCSVISYFPAVCNSFSVPGRVMERKAFVSICLYQMLPL